MVLHFQQFQPTFMQSPSETPSVPPSLVSHLPQFLMRFFHLHSSCEQRFVPLLQVHHCPGQTLQQILQRHSLSSQFGAVEVDTIPRFEVFPVQSRALAVLLVEAFGKSVEGNGLELGEDFVFGRITACGLSSSNGLSGSLTFNCIICFRLRL